MISATIESMKRKMNNATTTSSGKAALSVIARRIRAKTLVSRGDDCFGLLFITTTCEGRELVWILAAYIGGFNSS